jgi:hypothetical protein
MQNGYMRISIYVVHAGSDGYRTSVRERNAWETDYFATQQFFLTNRRFLATRFILTTCLELYLHPCHHSASLVRAIEVVPPDHRPWRYATRESGS